MKKKLITLAFVIMSIISYAQKEHFTIIGIPDVTIKELDNIKKIINSNKNFNYSYYCAKEKAIVLSSNTELSLQDIDTMFSQVIDIKKLFYKQIPNDVNDFCKNNSDNKILKQ